jgi:type II secretory pathway component PulF
MILLLAIIIPQFSQISNDQFLSACTGTWFSHTTYIHALGFKTTLLEISWYAIVFCMKSDSYVSTYKIDVQISTLTIYIRPIKDYLN